MSAEVLEELYEKLNFPSSTAFRKTLARRGIKARAEDVNEFVRARSERQILAPPPTYPGNIVSFHRDHRWAADLIAFMSRPASRKHETFIHVLLVEDLFTRFLLAKPLRTTSHTASAFREILAESERKPQRLDTDGGSEFTDGRFQALVAQTGIRHAVKAKDDLQAIAQLDSAISQLKKAIARRIFAHGGTWLDALDGAIEAHNGKVHSTTDAPPDDMDDDVAFSRMKVAAEALAKNGKIVKRRRERLEKAGAYRVFLSRTGGLRRRTDDATWSREVRTVASFPAPGIVKDTHGRETLTKHTLPVPKDSSTLTAEPAPRLHMLEVLREYAFLLRDALDTGKTFSAAARLIKGMRPYFTDALKRRSMTFATFVYSFPDLLKVEGGMIRKTPQ